MDAIEIYPSSPPIPRDEIQATIEIDETFIQGKLRTKDRSLMKIAFCEISPTTNSSDSATVDFSSARYILTKFSKQSGALLSQA